MNITHLLADLGTSQAIASLLSHVLWKAHLLKENFAVPIHTVMAVAGVLVGLASVKDALQEAVLEQRRVKEASGQALVLYIRLHRQCSEEVVYERLATFVKAHGPFDDVSSIDRMLAADRQSLLDRAQDLLDDDPDAIDKI